MTVREPQVKKGQRICTVEWCDEKHSARGYCREHYTRYAAGYPHEIISKREPLKRGRRKLGRDRVILIRLSEATPEDWVDHLREKEGLSFHRNAIYQAKTGKTYPEVPMDHDELMAEAKHRGLKLEASE